MKPRRNNAWSSVWRAQRGSGRPAIAARRPGDPHPYVIGQAAVQRYLTVVNECAQAGLANVR